MGTWLAGHTDDERTHNTGNERAHHSERSGRQPAFSAGRCSGSGAFGRQQPGGWTKAAPMSNKQRSWELKCIRKSARHVAEMYHSSRNAMSF